MRIPELIHSSVSLVGARGDDRQCMQVHARLIVVREECGKGRTLDLGTTGAVTGRFETGDAKEAGPVHRGYRRCGVVRRYLGYCTARTAAGLGLGSAAGSDSARLRVLEGAPAMREAANTFAERGRICGQPGLALLGESACYSAASSAPAQSGAPASRILMRGRG